MKFSIVTISYNQAQFLEEAIRSVLEQDYPWIEYIVVDPGSTDGSREIIERYRDRIAKIIFEADEGPAEGLNKGFSAATGDIFGFLNSDDVLEPGSISKVAGYFDRHPDTDVVSGHSWVIDAKGERKRRFYSDRYSKWMVAYGACALAQPSTFFRSQIFRRVGGFNIDNRSNWDGELFVDFALAGACFALVPKFWSRYRVHAEGITGSGRLHLLHQQHRKRMFEKIVQREPNYLDGVVAFGARWVRKMRNIPDTIERVRRGPVYRSV